MTAPDAGVDAIDHRAVARMIAVGRLAIGGVMLVAPGAVGRVWAGSAARDPGGKLLVRAIGGRDVVLGLGTLRALDGPVGAADDWVRAGAAADTIDAVASALAAPRVRRAGTWLTLLTAAVAAVLGWLAADRLD